VIGLFIGPLVLAVVHTLLSEWIRKGELRSAAGHPPTGA
jgi:hypothetical protein